MMLAYMINLLGVEQCSLCLLPCELCSQVMHASHLQVHLVPSKQLADQRLRGVLICRCHDTLVLRQLHCGHR